MASDKKLSHKKAHNVKQTREFRTREERIEAGRQLREKVPRESHAIWKPLGKARDVIAILQTSNKERLQELVPIRYGRMLRNPFSFYRGSASLMAYDLSKTPNIGVKVQACGDCHLLNFGLFATPERNLVFDLNDFDETIPAPWEWDVKRLAGSFALAALDNRHSDKEARDGAIACVRSYRENLRKYSKMNPLEVWYSRMDMQSLIDTAPDTKAKRLRQEAADRARERVVENLFPKIVGSIAGQQRIVDQPPVLIHVDDPEFMEKVQEGLDVYRGTLSDERRILLDRYRLADAALKIVGIGSVGTRCFIALMFSEENHPLILQIKESNHSVLAPYAGESIYKNQGERVVMGQRLMQSSSDIFLGWARGRAGRDFFVRQLRDMKFSVPVEGVTVSQIKRYAGLCGQALARAHAKSGDSATISGYLGKGDVFDKALGDFAVAYAYQTVKDHRTLARAVRAGHLEALMEEE